jgi:UDP-glucose:(heptosyl)LPS alpha-1,3-glucosyltransferase
MSSRPKKIAMVVPRYSRVGGGERFVMALTEQLAAMDGLEMHVFANRWDVESAGVHFHKVPIIKFPRFLTTLSFAYFANRRIAASGMDLIHTHDRILEADLFSAHGLPHAIWTREVRCKRLSWYDRVTAWTEGRLINSTRCRKILPVSTLVREKIVASFPQSTSKLQVITPGVDTAPFDALDRRSCRTQIRRRFGLADNDRIILFVGMNFEIKGLEAIIRALAGLNQIAPSLKANLLVVGKGDQRPYMSLARDLGINNKVIFAGVWNEEIAPVYLAADLFIMLSTFDTFGLTVLEAMAAALPVIISHTVGASDIVRPGENGYIVAPTQTQEISRTLALALSPEEHHRLSLGALQTARQYSWADMAKQISGIYSELFLMKNLS